MPRGSLNDAAFRLPAARKAVIACGGGPRVSVLLLDEGTSLSSANIASGHVLALRKRDFRLRFPLSGRRGGDAVFPSAGGRAAGVELGLGVVVG